MEGDAANRWPAYSFTFDDLNTFISSKARRHQWWLISFSLGRRAVRANDCQFSNPMKKRILVLGAGFGGLELSTMLSEAFGDGVDVTLIDKGDAFTFGYSKLDVMFGLTTLDAVRLPYRNFVKPGVRLLRQTVIAIDPVARRVTTDGGTYAADFLIVALGAAYDIDATPGLAEANEFYSVAGAERLRDVLPTFKRGRALVGVCGAPYKCPPAPSECALMLHDYLLGQGVREACEISFVLP